MSRSPVQHAIALFLQEINSQFIINNVLMFGSRARGDEHSESDIDLAVLMKDSKGDLLTDKLAMDDIAYDILLKTGLRIQPLPIWQNEWNNPEQYSNPYLIRNIQREGVDL